MIYQVLLSGNLDATSSLLEHAVVPALALLEWLLVGPARGRQPWWTPLSWLVLPVGYLRVYFNVRNRSGEPLYPFLDPGRGQLLALGGDHDRGLRRRRARSSWVARAGARTRRACPRAAGSGHTGRGCARPTRGTTVRPHADDAMQKDQPS